MKRKLLLVLLILTVIPYKVNANIVCNDGTISPSCSTCSKGCCSRHGGCSYSSNSGGNSYTTKKKTTTKKTTTAKPITTSTIETTTTTTEITTTEPTTTTTETTTTETTTTETTTTTTTTKTKRLTTTTQQAEVEDTDDGGAL